MPPTLKDMVIYFSQKGLPEKEAQVFFAFYQGQQWKTKDGVSFKKWKPLAWRWSQEFLMSNRLYFSRKVR